MKLSLTALIDVLSASLSGGGAGRQARATAPRTARTVIRMSALPHFPDHRFDVARARSGKRLSLLELCLILEPPLGGHVGAKVGRRHQLAARLEPSGAAATHRNNVTKKQCGAAGVHCVYHAAFEMRVALIEHRN